MREGRFLSLILGLICVIFIAPLASADSAIPVIAAWYGMILTIFMIPVIIIETIVAYLFLRWWSPVKISLLYVGFMIFVANIASWLFGMMLLLPISSHGYSSTDNVIVWLALAYLLSIVIEFIVIALFLRRKFVNPTWTAVFTSILINTVSYLIIIIVLWIMANS